MTDPEGRFIGATFLRNNLSKRSVTVNLKAEAGRDLVLELAPHFDVFAENFKSGALDRMGLGYDAIAAVHPSVIYTSLSGFGASGSPYTDWPAYASIAEAMSGIYDYVLVGDETPRPNPVGALGDISTGLFATIGILAALRHRDATGAGQRVDIAMYDATVAMTDIVTNFGSLGKFRLNEPKNAILDPFRASNGWFVLQLVREHQLERISQLVGHPEWVGDPRLATREGWAAHLEDMLRPAIEAWAADMTKLEAVEKLSAAGIASAPIQTAQEVLVDPHLEGRNMLVEMERTDGVERPVVIPGNPVKLSKMAEGPESRIPWVGEHTRAILADELGLDDDAIDALVADGVITD
jgi:crotonobetainyl-CoA:carnitine CoA-transferase CaiB-like acyl-CoA transferase